MPWQRLAEWDDFVWDIRWYNYGMGYFYHGFAEFWMHDVADVFWIEKSGKRMFAEFFAPESMPIWMRNMCFSQIAFGCRPYQNSISQIHLILGVSVHLLQAQAALAVQLAAEQDWVRSVETNIDSMIFDGWFFSVKSCHSFDSLLEALNLIWPFLCKICKWHQVDLKFLGVFSYSCSNINPNKSSQKKTMGLQDHEMEIL